MNESDSARTPRQPVRTRLGRAERRDQILAAATGAFTQEGGYAGTGLDDIARAAGISRMILYRHFESKRDLYRAAIDRAADRLHAATTDEHGLLGTDSVPNLVAWAGAEPDAFRLLFRYALGEAEFREEAERVRASMAAALGAQLPPSAADTPDDAGAGSDEAWRRWGARLATSMVIEGILSWLDLGRPDPDVVADRLLLAVAGVFRAIPDPSD